MTFDLEKARAETEHLRENIEEEFSCMCGVCHVCGFNPEEMKEGLAEIERLRADNAALSKAVIDIQEERDLAQAEFRAYHKAWEEQAAQIKELEDALVEYQRLGKVMNGRLPCLTLHGDCDRCSPRAKEVCEAMHQIAEGKIGPDAKPRSWQITDERVEAFGWILGRLEYDQSLPGHASYKIKRAAELLQAMLQEAGQ